MSLFALLAQKTGALRRFEPCELVLVVLEDEEETEHDLPLTSLVLSKARMAELVKLVSLELFRCHGASGLVEEEAWL